MSYISPFTDYIFPFTKDSVAALDGIPMAISRRQIPSGSVIEMDSLVFENGLWNGMECDFQDGVLTLLDDRSRPMFRINSLTVERGKVFMSGDDHRAAGPANKLQTTIHQRQELGDNWQVVISTCADYESMTCNRLVRSLTRSGVPADRITVVVGDVYEEDPQERSYRRLTSSGNFGEVNALLPLIVKEFEIEEDYVFLLHDTTEVGQDFASAVSKIDVGLPYDMITLSNWSNMGLYAVNFLQEMSLVRGLEWESNQGIANIAPRAVMERILGVMEAGRTKDVYGTGIQRRVFQHDTLPLKKYKVEKPAGKRSP